jgi:hypothetical protein
MTQISKVVPDFDLLFKSLQSKLESKGTWTDLLPTGVGTTILDMFAGTNISHQYYTDVNLREAFLPLAVRDSSIFSGTRMLGVHIARKVGASCSVELSNHSTQTRFIPPLTQFTVGSYRGYVRDQYTIPPGQTIVVDMYIGQPQERIFQLNSTPNLALKEFILGLPGFVVSEKDLFVYSRNTDSGEVTEWARTENALFESGPDDAVYFESTTRTGDVSLMFGDGNFGRRLQNNEELIVQFVTSDGAVSNNGLPGTEVKAVADTTVRGATLTSITGGADERSSIYYKQFAPVMHRTKRRAISNSDIRATIMGYPGIADCSLFGQRDIAPNDLRWMNTIRVCVLPIEQDTMGGANPNPRSAQWNAFVDWLHPRLHKAYTIQTWNPSKKFVDVRLRIALLRSALDGEVKIAATEAILKLFRKRAGILGRRLSISDISNAVKKIQGVDYVLVDSPSDEIVPQDAMEYVVLNGIPSIETFYSDRATAV